MTWTWKMYKESLSHVERLNRGILKFVFSNNEKKIGHINDICRFSEDKTAVVKLFLKTINFIKEGRAVF